NSDLDKEEKSQIRSKILYESTITTSQKLAFWASIGVNTAEFATAMTVIKGGVCLAKHCVVGAQWLAAAPEGTALAPTGPLGWSAGFLIETGELAAAMVLAHLFDKVVDPLSGSLIAWLDETDIQRQAEAIDGKVEEYLNEIKKASEFKNKNESREDCIKSLDHRVQTIAKKSAEQKKLEETIEEKINTILQEKLLKIAMSMTADEGCVPQLEKMPNELAIFYHRNKKRLQVQFKENMENTCKVVQTMPGEMRTWYSSQPLQADFDRIHQAYEGIKNEEDDTLPFESRIKRYDQIFVALDRLDIESQMEKMKGMERIAEFVNRPEGIRILPSHSPFDFSFEAVMNPKEQEQLTRGHKKSSSEQEFWITTSPSSFVVEMKKELDLLNQKLFNEYSMCKSENTKDEWTPFEKMEHDFNFIGTALFVNQGFKRLTESGKANDEAIQVWFEDKTRLNAFKGLLQHEQAALLNVNRYLKPRKGEKDLPKAEGSISWFAETKIAQINSQLGLSDLKLGKMLSEELYYKEKPGNEVSTVEGVEEKPNPQPRYIPEPPHRRFIPRRPGYE
ncbi:MAG: hypothetical protein HY559_00095, partial [Gammaproteobacteria bacterium]|nr:hypothetical protein [Gammaproteobacteria bacterium]